MWLDDEDEDDGPYLPKAPIVQSDSAPSDYDATQEQLYYKFFKKSGSRLRAGVATAYGDITNYQPGVWYSFDNDTSKYDTSSSYFSAAKDPLANALYLVNKRLRFHLNAPDWEPGPMYAYNAEIKTALSALAHADDEFVMTKVASDRVVTDFGEHEVTLPHFSIVDILKPSAYIKQALKQLPMKSPWTGEAISPENKTIIDNL